MRRQANSKRLYDCAVLDRRGDRIGSVKRVWLDDHTGRPRWASVHTGLIGSETFVPLQGARVGVGHITVHVDKERVQDAPHVHVRDHHLSPDEDARLCRHYGVEL
ncbi:hypothetical protein GCM10022243_32920 [Saccharothrix violaceirubra]|uniref:Sporulation protein YlmC with PRC-barrel domain n=1 Tax=Saccharothrix violaceirubra TaxID=413306 RepID=A0A7W7WV43_9PSEU|nr:PRC-barrel domain-containing protein [Saccharothrix violaceirubra]MBB4964143.1 sporulation protein YlmC with PRC-barrel domain [Saccharothrix violaceirubra]